MNVLHHDWVSLTRVIFHYFRVYCIFLFINILEQKGQQHFTSTTGSKVSLTWKEHPLPVIRKGRVPIKLE